MAVDVLSIRKNNMKKTIVITTINEKTEAISSFSKLLPNWDILLIGDKKVKLFCHQTI